MRQGDRFIAEKIKEDIILSFHHSETAEELVNKLKDEKRKIVYNLN